MIKSMIDVELLRKEPERVREGIKAKGTDPNLVDDFLEADNSWRSATQKLEALRAEQGKLSQARDIESAKANKEKIKVAEGEIAILTEERLDVWRKIPNLPSEDTPIGANETENKILRKVGEPKQFDFEPKDHLALGEALGLIDTQQASKVAGARFSYLMGDAVRLEFALVQYALDVLGDEKILKKITSKLGKDFKATTFKPILPPVMIRPDVFQKTSRLEPKEERYYLSQDDLYLVGSSEPTLLAMHMDTIFQPEELPKRYVGFSTSFRREAGSYGKDTRGILRVHQFDKVEMESFTLPEDSLMEQEFLVGVQEYLMSSLELPYQVVICCTADQGDTDARHIDIETWMPGQNRYRETHSADLTTDYQARRLNIRVKRNSAIEFVHTNDATVFAIGRTLIAILENHQTKDGKIEVPKVLQKYVGKKVIG